MQCDGDDRADVKYRMDIAQARFSSLHHIWKDHRLRRTMKFRLYKSSVCSTLTHACEAWDLTEDVRRLLNGFNSRCLHTITKRPHRATATNPEYNLVLAIRKRRLRYAGHILRMDPNRLVRRTLAAYVGGPYWKTARERCLKISQLSQATEERGTNVSTDSAELNILFY